MVGWANREVDVVVGGGGIGLLAASAALVLAMSAKAFKFSILESTGVSWKCQYCRAIYRDSLQHPKFCKLVAAILGHSLTS